MSFSLLAPNQNIPSFSLISGQAAKWPLDDVGIWAVLHCLMNKIFGVFMDLKSYWPVVQACLQHLNNEQLLNNQIIFFRSQGREAWPKSARPPHSDCPEGSSCSLCVPGVTVRQCHYFCVVYLKIIRKLHGRLLVSPSDPSLPRIFNFCWRYRSLGYKNYVGLRFGCRKILDF